MAHFLESALRMDMLPNDLEGTRAWETEATSCPKPCIVGHQMELSHQQKHQKRVRELPVQSEWQSCRWGWETDDEEEEVGGR